jgi:hypothetical protein
MPKSDDTTATEYLCFSEQRNKVCVGWDGCKGSFVIALDGYVVTLPKCDQIHVGTSVMGNVDIRATIDISPAQARALACWLLQALDEWPPPPEHELHRRLARG